MQHANGCVQLAQACEHSKPYIAFHGTSCCGGSPNIVYAKIQGVKLFTSITVVTGATDGIGKAYAYELAGKGFNVYLISRTQSKLEEVQHDILQKFNKISVKTFAFDFCVGSVDSYSSLLNALNEVDVGVLVNNVGMSYEYPEALHDVDGGVQRIGAITVINTLPPTVLSAHIIKQMLPRNKGVVINVASAAAYNHMALWAVYSATKKYVVWLTEILRMEYADTGLTIQTVCPMMVATKMSKVRRTSFFTPNAEIFAASAIRSIGLVDETTGFLSHQIQVTKINSKLPISLFYMATRKAALKKKAKAQ
ncbi:unnamed protein product [Heligmosomoides polygyrus]|uniref:NAD(P)-binding protein n=1 Tax=Heligmosomoides polygyrus TaxID=6339 RepID=A0A3P8DJR8_HELPZ|nr:unnamed protein product [Heligmosomoides polygyrus]